MALYENGNPQGTKRLTVDLTKEDASNLISELNSLLRSFGVNSYNGMKVTNPNWAISLNKVYRALTGEDHENCTPQNIEFMRQYNEEGKKLRQQRQEEDKHL